MTENSCFSNNPPIMPDIDNHNKLQIEAVIKNSNKYHSRNWDFEKAARYIFCIDNNILEASLFNHFLCGKFVKAAIELPISYGCIVKCKHCASSMLDGFKPLTALNLRLMVENIIDDANFNTKDPVLVTFSGIGEGSLHKNILKEASHLILNILPKAYFSYTTFGFAPDFISFCDKLALELPSHFLQISYLHHDLSKLIEIVPNARKLNFNFENLLHAISNANNINIRLNYILIKKFNDSDQHWHIFTDILNDLKSKLLLRLSGLNRTEASRLSGIEPCSKEHLFRLNSYLEKRGYRSYIFCSEQNDNMNCGQLAWNYR